MLDLGLDLLECYRIHYCDSEKKGAQPYVAPILRKNERQAFPHAGHTHSFYHCVYVLAAKNAQIQIESSQCSLVPGCFYLVKPEVLHGISAEKDYEIIMYEIKFSATHGDLTALLQELPSILQDPDGQVLRVVRELAHAFNDAVFRDELSCLKLAELLLTLDRIAQTTENTVLQGLKPYDLEKSRFAPLLSYITQNFPRHITVEQMAQIMHMEKGYFFKQFKKKFDVTPMAYLQFVRISRSLNLIEYTDMTIAEIAEAVGYPDHHTYIKNFKTFYEITPGEYRKKIQKSMQQKYANQES